MEVVLAVIGRPHGIKGEVVLEIRTDRPSERFAVGRAYATEGAPTGADGATEGGAIGADGAAGADGAIGAGGAELGRLTLRSYRATPKQVVAGFEEIRDRTAAEALRGIKLLADVDPSEEADAWYAAQLRGAAVFLPDGTPVGEVRDLVSLPGQDLLEIAQAGAGTALVPLVKELVPEVDPARGRIVIDPPAGLVAARPAEAEG
ncbi:MAG: ribosome maturation factor RimM [Bifidobacteriaceae bacterium]|jgi:16S rRNA processing protein RimM|nr:ribosome maturation factor RimM [Bifidobacteriaceae bacterium]